MNPDKAFEVLVHYLTQDGAWGDPQEAAEALGALLPKRAPRKHTTDFSESVRLQSLIDRRTKELADIRLAYAFDEVEKHEAAVARAMERWAKEDGVMP